MANDKLSEQSMDFAVQIINLVKQLKEQRESIISNQIGRSGTSIGANIHEAQYAQGKKDFISKLKLHSKRRVKQAIGWSLHTERITLLKSNMKFCPINAPLFA